MIKVLYPIKGNLIYGKFHNFTNLKNIQKKVLKVFVNTYPGHA